MRSQRSLVVLALIVTAAASLSFSRGVFAQSPSGADTERASKRAAQSGGPRIDFAGMLLSGLRNTEGCLGADAGSYQSGKNTIVAWFEDKAAAMRWYNHPVHRGVMRGFGTTSDREPMEHVPDSGPIMVVATIKPSTTDRIPGFPLPISAISIELFAPLPGGAYINERLAPETFKVPHMRKLVVGENADSGSAGADRAN